MGGPEHRLGAAPKRCLRSRATPGSCATGDPLFAMSVTVRSRCDDRGRDRLGLACADAVVAFGTDTVRPARSVQRWRLDHCPDWPSYGQICPSTAPLLRPLRPTFLLSVLGIVRVRSTGMQPEGGRL